MELTNKTYVVTGATSGIGLAAARALAEAGANVIAVGRSEERCRRTEAELRLLNSTAAIRCFVFDLSLQSEVRRLSAEIRDYLASHQIPVIDGLINVAGTFTYWLDLTAEGIERQWAVNHLAGFLLTHELLPLLAAAPEARIITVSSGSHFGARIDWRDPQLRRRYNGLKAYGVTKLANILFTRELNNRLATSTNIHAFAVDPGLVNTDIGLKDTSPIVSWVWKIRRSGGTSAELPARCILYLLTAPPASLAHIPYWKNSRPKRASRAAVDPSSASRLWHLSENLCSLNLKA